MKIYKVIEFKATIKNGVIEIPKEYKDFMNGEIKIIAMKEILDDKDKDNIEDDLLFNEIQIDTKKWKFNRKEIYD